MTFGEDWGFGSTVEESEAILDRFFDAGGNFIDTANVYTKGHSETIIGDHVGRHAGRRQKAVIATKFFGGMYAGDPNAGGANRKSITAACEHSLRRLQTDYIDLYWMHAWDATTPIGETMRALDDLVTAGKVRYIGFSDTPAWKVAEAQVTADFRGWSPLVALQIEYSLVERTVEGELIPMAGELGLGITPWSPLKGGVLTGKYTRENAGEVEPARGEWVTGALNEDSYRIVDVLSQIAAEIGSTPAQVALAWVQGRPGVTSTIIGARTMSQLDKNLAALDLELDGKHLESLDEVSKPRLNFPAEFLQRAPAFAYAGTTINGQSTPVLPMMPTDDERY
jgi:aryl-alcohol dehydrogenase-like predicted oxidoreductase